MEGERSDPELINPSGSRLICPKGLESASAFSFPSGFCFRMSGFFSLMLGSVFPFRQSEILSASGWVLFFLWRT